MAEMNIDMEKDIKECLAAVNQILSYLNKYEDTCSETFWRDKNGNEIHGDMGYFFDGLYELKYYCEKQIK